MDCTRGYDLYLWLLYTHFYRASRDRLQTENTTHKQTKKKKKKTICFYTFVQMAAGVNVLCDMYAIMHCSRCDLALNVAESMINILRDCVVGRSWRLRRANSVPLFTSYELGGGGETAFGRKPFVPLRQTTSQALLNSYPCNFPQPTDQRQQSVK